jgi:hypothetical protein
MSSSFKKTIEEVSAALKDLHKSLLMLEAKILESESGRALNPYELLHATLNEPSLAWLRKLSALIVTIDTLLDEVANLTANEASQVADAIFKLIERPPENSDGEFWRKYSGHLSNAEVILRHSRVKDLATRLRPKM